MVSTIFHKTDTYPERFFVGIYNRSGLDVVIKAYDVRGVAGEGTDADLVGAIGAALGHIMRSEGATRAVVGHDMCEPSPELATSLTDGAAAQGLNITLLGLTSTDELYFVSGVKGRPDAVFAASHDPAEYNGIKMCRSLARSIGQEIGLTQIKDLLVDGIPEYTGTPGETGHEDVPQDYTAFLHGLVDIRSGRRLKVAVDAGSGMGGLTVPVAPGEDMNVADLYFEFDGNLSNYETDPLEPVNLVDLQKFTVEQGADTGIVFDGDAGRCFVADEKGNPVNPPAICVLVVIRYLEQNPGAAIIHNLITLCVVPKTIVENGGTPVRTRVGHSFIKAQMAEHSAVSGGEHSAYHYFKEFFNADPGMLAAVHVLAALAEQDKPLSEFMAEYNRYETSGRINSRLGSVEEQQVKQKEIEAAFVDRTESSDWMDGLVIELADSKAWFNVQASNTELLPCLNVEALTCAEADALVDEALGTIRG